MMIAAFNDTHADCGHTFFLRLPHKNAALVHRRRLCQVGSPFMFLSSTPMFRYVFHCFVLPLNILLLIITYTPTSAAIPPKNIPARAFAWEGSPSCANDISAVCVSTKQSKVDDKLIALSALASSALLFLSRNA